MKKLSGTYFNSYLSRLCKFAEARTFRFHDISSDSYDNIIKVNGSCRPTYLWSRSIVLHCSSRQARYSIYSLSYLNVLNSDKIALILKLLSFFLAIFSDFWHFELDWNRVFGQIFTRQVLASAWVYCLMRTEISWKNSYDNST